MKLLSSDPCPNCQHPLGYHKDYGCEVDWAWNAEGLAIVVGCECNLGIVD